MAVDGSKADEEGGVGGMINREPDQQWKEFAASGGVQEIWALGVPWKRCGVLEEDLNPDTFDVSDDDSEGSHGSSPSAHKAPALEGRSSKFGHKIMENMPIDSF
ncbi:hypothetical protein PTI98_006898 [Pleurotus ostreatus]|nr:hypothetical protein PTI98_006898 [Pleurotus ostreatus]